MRRRNLSAVCRLSEARQKNRGRSGPANAHDRGVLSLPENHGPYRQPAEDVEAKQDAIEVARFADKLQREKKRSLGLAAIAGILGTGAMVATVYMIVAIRSPLPRHHGCRTVYQITVHGNDAIRTEHRVCPGDDDPFATSTTVD
jgi:hypothetical protein